MGHAAQDMAPAACLTADEWNDEWDKQMGVEKDSSEERLEGSDESTGSKLTFFEKILRELPLDKPAEERGRGIAEKALKIINGERQDEYGAPEDNFRAIARLWTAYIVNKWLDVRDVNFHLTDANVADMMVLFKMARMQTGRDKLDSSADLLGYALLGADLRGAK